MLLKGVAPIVNLLPGKHVQMADGTFFEYIPIHAALKHGHRKQLILSSSTGVPALGVATPGCSNNLTCFAVLQHVPAFAQQITSRDKYEDDVLVVEEFRGVVSEDICEAGVTSDFHMMMVSSKVANKEIFGGGFESVDELLAGYDAIYDAARKHEVSDRLRRFLSDVR